MAPRSSDEARIRNLMLNYGYTRGEAEEALRSMQEQEEGTAPDLMLDYGYTPGEADMQEQEQGTGPFDVFDVSDTEDDEEEDAESLFIESYRTGRLEVPTRLETQLDDLTNPTTLEGRPYGFRELTLSAEMEPEELSAAVGELREMVRASLTQYGSPLLTDEGREAEVDRLVGIVLRDNDRINQREVNRVLMSQYGMAAPTDVRDIFSERMSVIETPMPGPDAPPQLTQDEIDESFDLLTVPSVVAQQKSMEEEVKTEAMSAIETLVASGRKDLPYLSDLITGTMRVDLSDEEKNRRLAIIDTGTPEEVRALARREGNERASFEADPRQMLRDMDDAELREWMRTHMDDTRVASSFQTGDPILSAQATLSAVTSPAVGVYRSVRNIAQDLGDYGLRTQLGNELADLVLPDVGGILTEDVTREEVQQQRDERIAAINAAETVQDLYDLSTPGFRRQEFDAVDFAQGSRVFAGGAPDSDLDVDVLRGKLLDLVEIEYPMPRGIAADELLAETRALTGAQSRRRSELTTWLGVLDTADKDAIINNLQTDYTEEISKLEDRSSDLQAEIERLQDQLGGLGDTGVPTASVGTQLQSELTTAQDRFGEVARRLEEVSISRSAELETLQATDVEELRNQSRAKTEQQLQELESSLAGRYANVLDLVGDRVRLPKFTLSAVQLINRATKEVSLPAMQIAGIIDQQEIRAEEQLVQAAEMRESFDAVTRGIDSGSTDAEVYQAVAGLQLGQYVQSARGASYREVDPVEVYQAFMLAGNRERSQMGESIFQFVQAYSEADPVKIEQGIIDDELRRALDAVRIADLPRSIQVKLFDAEQVKSAVDERERAADLRGNILRKTVDTGFDQLMRGYEERDGRLYRVEGDLGRALRIMMLPEIAVKEALYTTAYYSIPARLMPGVRDYIPPRAWETTNYFQRVGGRAITGNVGLDIDIGDMLKANGFAESSTVYQLGSTAGYMFDFLLPYESAFQSVPRVAYGVGQGAMFGNAMYSMAPLTGDLAPLNVQTPAMMRAFNKARAISYGAFAGLDSSVRQSLNEMLPFDAVEQSDPSLYVARQIRALAEEQARRGYGVLNGLNELQVSRVVDVVSEVLGKTRSEVVDMLRVQTDADRETHQNFITNLQQVIESDDPGLATLYASDSYQRVQQEMLNSVENTGLDALGAGVAMALQVVIGSRRVENGEIGSLQEHFDTLTIRSTPDVGRAEDAPSGARRAISPPMRLVDALPQTTLDDGNKLKLMEELSSNDPDRIDAALRSLPFETFQEAITAMAAPTYYSAVRQAIQNIFPEGQERINAATALKAIERQPNVRNAELQATGLRDYLQQRQAGQRNQYGLTAKDRQVTKAELLEYFDRNAIELVEVNRSERHAYFRDYTLGAGRLRPVDDEYREVLLIQQLPGQYQPLTASEIRQRLKDLSDVASLVEGRVRLYAVGTSQELVPVKRLMTGEGNIRQNLQEINKDTLLLTTDPDTFVPSLGDKYLVFDLPMDWPSLVIYDQFANGERAFEVKTVDLVNADETDKVFTQELGPTIAGKDQLALLKEKEKDTFSVEELRKVIGDVADELYPDGIVLPSRVTSYNSVIRDLSKRIAEKYNQYMTVEKGKSPVSGFVEPDHFSEPNIVVHLRLKSMTDADGNRVLMAEEVQSDFYQKARRGEPMGQPTPFMDNWLNVGLKRLIRIAAEEGYDQIAWTTGRQQYDRYDPYRDIEYVAWVPNFYVNDGSGELFIQYKDEYQPVSLWGKPVDGDTVAEWIGRDNYERLHKEAIAFATSKEARAAVKQYIEKDDDGQNLVLNVDGTILASFGQRSLAVDAAVEVHLYRDVIAQMDRDIEGMAYPSYRYQELAPRMPKMRRGMIASYDQQIPRSMRHLTRGTTASIGFLTLPGSNFDDGQPRKVNAMSVPPELRQRVLFDSQPLMAVGPAKDTALSEADIRRNQYEWNKKLIPASPGTGLPETMTVESKFTAAQRRKAKTLKLSKSLGPQAVAENLIEMDRIMQGRQQYGPLTSERNWALFMLRSTGVTRNLKPPPKAMEYARNPQAVADLIGQMTDQQRSEARAGIAEGKLWREMYESGRMPPEATALLFCWGSASKMLGAYKQEAGFLDMFHGGVLDYIRKALNGEWDLSPSSEKGQSVTMAEYRGFVSKVFSNTSPGNAAKTNMNDFGKFLERMSQPIVEGPHAGKTPLLVLHEMLSAKTLEMPTGVDADGNVTYKTVPASGKAIRRLFWLTVPQAVGINNKVLSFMLLITGHRDVFVFDRIQVRHMWDAANRIDEYGIANIYDGWNVPASTRRKTPHARPWSNGSLAGALDNLRGLLVYEAIEDGLRESVAEGYRILGRDGEGEMGTFHWESWVIFGEQEVNHGSVHTIRKFALGDTEPMAGVEAFEGDMRTWDYGFSYNPARERKFAFKSPSGVIFELTPTQKKEFIKRLKSDANRTRRKPEDVFENGFQITKRPDPKSPWTRQPGLRIDRLDELLEQVGAVPRPDGGAVPATAVPADAADAVADVQLQRGQRDVTARTPQDSAGVLPSAEIERELAALVRSGVEPEMAQNLRLLYNEGELNDQLAIQRMLSDDPALRSFQRPELAEEQMQALRDMLLSDDPANHAAAKEIITTFELDVFDIGFVDSGEMQRMLEVTARQMAGSVYPDAQRIAAGVIDGDGDLLPDIDIKSATFAIAEFFTPYHSWYFNKFADEAFVIKHMAHMLTPDTDAAGVRASMEQIAQQYNVDLSKVTVVNDEPARASFQFESAYPGTIQNALQRKYPYAVISLIEDMRTGQDHFIEVGALDMVDMRDLLDEVRQKNLIVPMPKNAFGLIRDELQADPQPIIKRFMTETINSMDVVITQEGDMTGLETPIAPSRKRVGQYTGDVNIDGIVSPQTRNDFQVDIVSDKTRDVLRFEVKASNPKTQVTEGQIVLEPTDRGVRLIDIQMTNSQDGVSAVRAAMAPLVEEFGRINIDVRALDAKLQGLAITAMYQKGMSRGEALRQHVEAGRPPIQIIRPEYRLRRPVQDIVDMVSEFIADMAKTDKPLQPKPKFGKVKTALLNDPSTRDLVTPTFGLCFDASRLVQAMCGGENRLQLKKSGYKPFIAGRLDYTTSHWWLTDMEDPSIRYDVTGDQFQFGVDVKHWYETGQNGSMGQWSFNAKTKRVYQYKLPRPGGIENQMVPSKKTLEFAKRFKAWHQEKYGVATAYGMNWWLAEYDRANTVVAEMEGKGEVLYPERADVLARTPALQEIAKTRRDILNKGPSEQRRLELNRLREEHAAAVQRDKPVLPYTAVPVPATVAQMEASLGAKADSINQNANMLSEGALVASRLDIPSYSKSNTWVVSIHTPKSLETQQVGKVKAYRSFVAMRNAKFNLPNQSALKTASGKSKSSYAAVKGEYLALSEAEVVERMNAALTDPAFRQVGYDPERHSYFYDRETMTPYESAEEVYQIGPLVMAKNPVEMDLIDAADALYTSMKPSGRRNFLTVIAEHAEANPSFTTWRNRFDMMTNPSLRNLNRLQQVEAAQAWFVPPEGYTITQREDGRYEATGPDAQQVRPDYGDSFATLAEAQEVVSTKALQNGEYEGRRVSEMDQDPVRVGVLLQCMTPAETRQAMAGELSEHAVVFVGDSQVARALGNNHAVDITQQQQRTILQASSRGERSVMIHNHVLHIGMTSLSAADIVLAAKLNITRIEAVTHDGVRCVMEVPLNFWQESGIAWDADNFTPGPNFEQFRTEINAVHMNAMRRINRLKRKLQDKQGGALSYNLQVALSTPIFLQEFNDALEVYGAKITTERDRVADSDLGRATQQVPDGPADRADLLDGGDQRTARKQPGQQVVTEGDRRVARLEEERGLESTIRPLPPFNQVVRDFAGRVIEPIPLTYDRGSGPNGGYEVVSLFDGISAARVAFENANLPIDNYYASEVDKGAINIAQANFPDTKQLGSVTDIENPDSPNNVSLPAQFDILIGGSPCQDLRKGREGLAGSKSKLFFEYKRIFDLGRHRYFIFENTTQMSDADKAVITEAFGVYPIMIDGGRVSAATRKRYFWTNIPQAELPLGPWITMQDVMLPLDEAKQLGPEQIGTPLTANKIAYLEKMYGNKSRYSTWGYHYRPYRKAKTLLAGAAKGSASGITQQRGEYRKLARVEAERLMGFPDGYTNIGSRNQALHGLGNSYTVPVIESIVSYLSNEADTYNVLMEQGGYNSEAIRTLLGEQLDLLSGKAGMLPQSATTAEIVAALLEDPDPGNVRQGVMLAESMGEDFISDLVELGVDADFLSSLGLRSPLTLTGTIPPEFKDQMVDLVKSGDPDLIQQAREFAATFNARLDLSGGDFSGDLISSNGLPALNGIDLSNVNLGNANFKGANLFFSNFNGANLKGANLNGATLTGAVFIGVNFNDADLSGAEIIAADLSDADLRGANLSSANLSRSDLTGIIYDETTTFPAGFTPPPSAPIAGSLESPVQLTGTIPPEFKDQLVDLVKSGDPDNARVAREIAATFNSRLDLSGGDFSGADLSGADLNEMDFSGANLSGADLSEANLSSSNFSGANLSGANFSSITFSDADLSGVNLNGANFSGANLSKVNLRRTDLRGINLSGANLYEAEFGSADLRGANLNNANLSETSFNAATLSMANLRGAVLSEGYFIGTDLSEADLSGADLRSADLSVADLTDIIYDNIIYDDTTVFPEDFTPPPSAPIPTEGLESPIEPPSQAEMEAAVTGEPVPTPVRDRTPEDDLRDQQVQELLNNLDAVVKMTYAEANADAFAKIIARVMSAGDRQLDFRTIDGMLDWDQVPVLQASDLIGIKYFPTFADRTATAVTYEGIPGAPLSMAVPLLGGPLFPLRLSNLIAGIVWANRGQSIIGAKQGKITSKGATHMVVMLGSSDMHQSNTTVFYALMMSLLANRKAGVFDAEGADDIVFELAGDPEIKGTGTQVPQKLPNAKETYEMFGLAPMPTIDRVVLPDDFNKWPEFIKTKQAKRQDHEFVTFVNPYEFKATLFKPLYPKGMWKLSKNANKPVFDEKALTIGEGADMVTYKTKSAFTKALKVVGDAFKEAYLNKPYKAYKDGVAAQEDANKGIKDKHKAAVAKWGRSPSITQEQLAAAQQAASVEIPPILEEVKAAKEAKEAIAARKKRRQDAAKGIETKPVEAEPTEAEPTEAEATEAKPVPQPPTQTAAEVAAIRAKRAKKEAAEQLLKFATKDGKILHNFKVNKQKDKDGVYDKLNTSYKARMQAITIAEAKRKFPGFDNEQALVDYSQGLSFDARKAIIQYFANNKTEAITGVPAQTVLDATNEAILAGSPLGTGALLIELETVEVLDPSIIRKSVTRLYNNDLIDEDSYISMRTIANDDESSAQQRAALTTRLMQLDGEAIDADIKKFDAAQLAKLKKAESKGKTYTKLSAKRKEGVFVELGATDPTDEGYGSIYHSDFPLGVKGKIVGRFAVPPTSAMLFQDHYNDPDNIAKMEKGQEHRVYRALTLKLPVQELTAKIAQDLDALQVSGITTVTHAGLVSKVIQGKTIRAYTNEEIKSGARPTEDGTFLKGPSQYLNETTATLSQDPMSAAIKPTNPKDSLTSAVNKGDIRLHQFGDYRLYYAMRRTDSGFRLESVVNNALGTRGLGETVAILDAIANGANEALAVPGAMSYKLCRHLGFVPQGAVNTESTTPVILKLEGVTNDTAVESYFRSGPAGLLEGRAASVGASTEADVVRGYLDGDGGDRAADDALRDARLAATDGDDTLSSAARRIAQTIVGLNPETIAALGLSETDKQSIVELLGVENIPQEARAAVMSRIDEMRRPASFEARVEAEFDQQQALEDLTRVAAAGVLGRPQIEATRKAIMEGNETQKFAAMSLLMRQLAEIDAMQTPIPPTELPPMYEQMALDLVADGQVERARELLAAFGLGLDVITPEDVAEAEAASAEPVELPQTEPQLQRQQDDLLGYYIKSDGQHIIHMFKTGDTQTLWHETGHMLITLMGEELGHKLLHIFQPDTHRLTEYGERGYEAGDVAEEMMADAFAVYVERRRIIANQFQLFCKLGVAPNGQMFAAFDMVQNKLRNIWSKVRKDGKWLPPEALAIWDQWLNPQRMADGIAADIAEAKQAEPPTVTVPKDASVEVLAQQTRLRRKERAKKLRMSREEMMRQMKLTEGTNVKLNNLLLDALELVIVEEGRKRFGDVQYRMMTPRTTVPAGRVRAIQKQSNEQLEYIFGTSVRDVSRSQSEGGQRVGDKIVLTPEQANRLHAVAAGLMLAPYGKSIPRRLALGPVEEIGLYELNAIVEAVIDTNAGLGSARSHSIESLRPGFGQAIMRSLRTVTTDVVMSVLTAETPTRAAQETQTSLDQTLSQLDDAEKTQPSMVAPIKRAVLEVISAGFKLLDEVFVFKDPLSGEVDPNLQSLMREMQADLANVKNWVLRLHRESIRTQRGQQLSDNTKTLAEALNDIREQLTPPVLLEHALTLEDIRLTLYGGTNTSSAMVEAVIDGNHTRLESVLQDSFINKLAEVTKPVHTFDAINNTLTVPKEDPMVVAAVQTLHNAARMLAAEQPMDATTTEAVAQALSVLLREVEIREQLVDMRADDIAVALTGSKQSMENKERAQLYVAFYSGQWTQQLLARQRQANLAFTLQLEANSERGWNTLEEWAATKVGIEIGNNPEIFVEMLTRLRAMETLSRFSSQLVRYGYLDNEGAQRLDPIETQRVAFYIRQILQDAVFVVEEQTDRTVLSVARPPGLQSHDRDAYQTAKGLLSRFGIQQVTDTKYQTWDKYTLPNGDELLLPQPLIDFLKGSLSGTAPVGDLASRLLAYQQKDLHAMMEAVSWYLAYTSQLKLGVTVGTLIPNAAYYTGNTLGMLFQIHMAQGIGGIETLSEPMLTGKVTARLALENYQEGQVESPNMLGGGLAPDSRKSSVLVTPDGRVYTDAMIANLAKRFGLDTSFIASEIVTGLIQDVQRQHGSDLDMLKRMLTRPIESMSGMLRQPLETMQRGGKLFLSYQNMLIEAASGIDNYFRVGIFISELKKGKSPEAAAETARDIGYDYSRLTEIERKYLRQVFFFYSFMKVNTLYFINQMLSNPSSVMAQFRLLRGLQRYHVEDDEPLELLPEYVQGRLIVGSRNMLPQQALYQHAVNMASVSGYVTLAPPMPGPDALALMLAVMTLPTTPTDSVQTLLPQMHPLISASIVFGTNIDPLTNRQLRETIPANFIMLDRNLFGGALVANMAGGYTVDRSTGQQIFVPNDPKAWYAFQQGLSFLPNFGRSANSFEALDRADIGLIEAMVLGSDRIGGLYLDKEDRYSFDGINPATARPGLTRREEMFGYLGFRTMPVPSRLAVRERAYQDAMQRVQSETQRLESMQPDPLGNPPQGNELFMEAVDE